MLLVSLAVMVSGAFWTLIATVFVTGRKLFVSVGVKTTETRLTVAGIQIRSGGRRISQRAGHVRRVISGRGVQLRSTQGRAVSDVRRVRPSQRRRGRAGNIQGPFREHVRAAGFRVHEIKRPFAGGVEAVEICQRSRPRGQVGDVRGSFVRPSSSQMPVSGEPAGMVVRF